MELTGAAMAGFQGIHPPHLPTLDRHQAIALPTTPTSFFFVFPSCASSKRNEFTESGIPPTGRACFILALAPNARDRL